MTRHDTGEPRLFGTSAKNLADARGIEARASDGIESARRGERVSANASVSGKQVAQALSGRPVALTLLLVPPLDREPTFTLSAETEQYLDRMSFA